MSEPTLAQMTGASPPRQQSAAFAVTSLVLGLVSVVPFLTLVVTAPLAIIFGSLRLRAGSAGRGMAVAGFTLGVVVVVVWTTVIVVARIR